MTRSLLAFLLLLGGLTLQAQPRLVVAEPVADAGRLSVGRQQERTVVFECRNAGSEPLTFTSFESSCPCVDVRLPKKPLRPGRKARIRVTFHARDLDDRGVVTNLITLYYSGPGRYTRVRLRAELTD